MLTHVSDLIRSSFSTDLFTSQTSRATIGGRCFSAAVTSVWNSLPESVRSSVSLALFRKTLKTELFVRSYTDEQIQYALSCDSLLVFFCSVTWNFMSL